MLVLIGWCSNLGAETSRRIEGLDFPEFIAANASSPAWRLRSLGVFRSRFVPYYAVALYLPAEGVRRDELMLGFEPFRAEVAWVVPELSQQRVHALWSQLLNLDLDEITIARLAPRREKFLNLFGEARRGERLELLYEPDGGMTVRAADGTQQHFTGVEFSRVLIRAVLGGSDGQLRAQLLEGLEP